MPVKQKLKRFKPNNNIVLTEYMHYYLRTAYFLFHGGELISRKIFTRFVMHQDLSDRGYDEDITKQCIQCSQTAVSSPFLISGCESIL
jgi:hypothetical protein